MSTETSGIFTAYALLALPFAAMAASHAAVPTLFSRSAYESPERGDPDDLLLLSGDGLSVADRVVYQALPDTTAPPAHPTAVPIDSTASLGVLDLVSVADAPHSLIVHLPNVMAAGQAYALWVVAPGGQWSTPVLINDARPLWISPDSAYRSAGLVNQLRMLKVIGRNLQPAPSLKGATQVRLVGTRTGTTYTLPSVSAQVDIAEKTLSRYTAVLNLPSPLVVDEYKVLLNRDGTSWVPLIGAGHGPAQVFTVLADPARSRTFPIGDFARAADSPCLPNDHVDDTKCILLAIRAAAAAPGGGTVVFGPGIWTMSNPGRWPPGSSSSDIFAPSGVTFDGILIPRGVNLQGGGTAGPDATTIERGVGWSRKSESVAAASLPGFTLQGDNRISGLIFKDDNDYRAAAGGAMLQLGLTWYRARLYGATDPLVVSNIVISHNLFDKPYIAIGNGGLPIDHAYITYNVFGGAYNTAIYLVQDTNEVKNLLASALLPYRTYSFSDSVIGHNTFHPSSWNYTTTSGNYGDGTIATQISTGLRIDFSDNFADGASRHYLYDPASDAKGWRGGYFWSTGANQEMTLVSSNAVTCAGDKNGDGEAFAYDGSVTLGGLPTAERVIAAAPWAASAAVTGTTLTLEGPLVSMLASGGHVDISANPTAYYRGFWVQVVSGTGKGQWRKLETVAIGARPMPTVALNVTPAFDVLPDDTSRVSIGHAYWQNETVNNTADQRTPLCTKANTRASGGGITWYDSTADSVMDGNRLYDSSGVFVHQNYAPPQQPIALIPASVTLQSANQIRDNLIDGVYDRSNARSAGGGIQLGYGAVDRYCAAQHCEAAPVPPALGYGISISGNSIRGADSSDPMNSKYSPRGAITLSRDWTTGPLDASGQAQWQLGDSTLIFHNTLRNISTALTPAMPLGIARVGIGIDPLEQGNRYSMNAWRTTLYANVCDAVDTPVSDAGVGTIRYCPSGNTDTCECHGSNSIHVGLMASASESAVKAGGTVTYLATVRNLDAAASANDVMLMLERPAGIQVSEISVTSGAGSCNAATNICLLGEIAHGQSANITVAARALRPGTWNTTLSVTHREPDTEVGGSGVTLSTVVK